MCSLDSLSEVGSLMDTGPPPNAMVKLNVGGLRLASTAGTLSEAPFFASMFSGRWRQHLTDDGEVFLDRDGDLFRHVLQFLRGRACAADAAVLPADPGLRAALRGEARFYGLSDLEAMLRDDRDGDGGDGDDDGDGDSSADGGCGGGLGPSARGFAEAYRQQAREAQAYVAQQPFAAAARLLHDILLGRKPLRSPWNPALEQGAIAVSLMEAPLVRVCLSVAVASDHVRLCEGRNRFKVVLPDRLLERVSAASAQEVYLYEFAGRDEVADLNHCLLNLGTRAVLLRMLRRQGAFAVELEFTRRARSSGEGPSEFELALSFARLAQGGGGGGGGGAGGGARASGGGGGGGGGGMMAAAPVAGGGSGGGGGALMGAPGLRPGSGGGGGIGGMAALALAGPRRLSAGL